MIEISELWHSRESALWYQALDRYWDLIRPANETLERCMEQNTKADMHKTARRLRSCYGLHAHARGKKERRMKKAGLLVLLFLVVLNGCATRSISNSGYSTGGYYGRGSDNPLYKGELSEFDVLGIDAGKEIEEQDIAAAAVAKKDRLSFRKGDSLLLIQSGAMMPDQVMTENAEKYFSVSVFTGVPEQDKKANVSYAKALRLAAAKAGIDKILVYWGVLESGTKNLVTKSVSWVPMVGSAVPDQSQEIRIRLKVALIDVKTGQWEIFVPKVFEDTAFSASLTRENSDQQQVALLKAKAYQAAIESTLARYAR